MNKLIQLIALTTLTVGLAACGGQPADKGTLPTINISGSSAVTALKVTDTTVGTGAAVANGNTVSVNYTGWLYDVAAPNFEGTQFDKSGATPFSFVLGAGQVIAGFDQGLVGMKVGGTRTLIIPSALAYGTAGSGTTIPPDSALVFSVTLVSFK